MSSTSTLQSEQPSREPFSGFSGEQTPLEKWVGESFHALDELQAELLAWQAQLEQQQAEIQLRENKLEKAQWQEQDLREKMENWKHELEQARAELQQVENKSSQQLHELAELESRQVALEAELKVASERRDEISATLEAERAETAAERQAWRDEFQQMRQQLEKNNALLGNHVADAT